MSEYDDKSVTQLVDEIVRLRSQNRQLREALAYELRKGNEIREENDRLTRLVALYEQPRIVHVDVNNCRHNRAIEPDTGECLDCGTVLP